ncbi:MAG: hypothetical protein ACYTEL_19925 [Planctomycetota bacterium]|jgi:sirohydrochlorin ferrochelatase
METRMFSLGLVWWVLVRPIFLFEVDEQDYFEHPVSERRQDVRELCSAMRIRPPPFSPEAGKIL